VSSPSAEDLSALVDRVLESQSRYTQAEVAVSLGVDSTYVQKLRAGWRPSRVRPEILARLRQLDPAGPKRAPQPPGFYDGVLYAAQAMAETQARLIAEARAGLAARLTPAEALAELDEGEALLEAAERQLAAKEAPQSRVRKRA
jgi:hypothetical protein